MAQLDPEELGRRLRAARGYAGGRSQRVFAKELGIGESSLKRLEAGDEGPAEVKLEAIITRAAEEARLPRTFFTLADLWVLDYLEQAISMLPEAARARARDELVFEAFESYERELAQATARSAEGTEAVHGTSMAPPEFAERLSRVEARLEELSREGVERDLEDAEQRDAGTDAGEEAGQGDREEGDGA